MSSSRRAKRERTEKRKKLEKQRLQEEMDAMEDELTPEEEAMLLEKEAEEGGEKLEKAYDGYAEAAEVVMKTGPTSFEELEDARASAKKASAIRQMSWDVEDLVRNIINSPMLQGTEKADAIKKVGRDFGDRVQGVMETPATMMKSHDDNPDVLEIEAIIAQDERETGLLEKAFNGFQKKVLTSAARKALSDSDFALVYEVDGKKVRKYPIHDKAHVRNALSRAAQQIKTGGKAAADARKALPKIRAAAKKMGIGADMKKEKSGIIIQKDAQGDWRWVGWPSNNFIDRSSDILTEEAHKEYVTWWHKNKDDLGFPVFTSMHAPGTAREHPVDFVGYENGFLVMSGKLTETEAVRLLKNQKKYDIGMSHTGFGVRSQDDPRQIVMYRTYEVTDLPLEIADNPFTDLAVISKEDDMDHKDQVEYLAGLMGSEELAEEALSAKTSMKQAELLEAGIEQKEAKQEKPETAPEKDALPDMKELAEQIGKEFDMEGLDAFVKDAQEAIEKIPLLEDLVKQQQATIAKLSGEQDEALAQKIAPPAGRFAWSKERRASQADETLVDGDDLEALEKKAPGVPDGYWLSEVTGTAPVAESN